MILEDLGFNSDYSYNFSEYASTNLKPARVSLEHKGSYVVFAEFGEMPALLAGKMFYEADANGLPIVGDWVAAQILNEQPPKAIIQAILPRKSKFSRKEAGKKVSEQPIAANVDTVFIVVGLDCDFNVRRIERYLALSWQSGAEPVVLLTKADLCEDLEEKLDAVRASALGAPVLAVSVFQKQGLEQLGEFLVKGCTIALLGSSGVGKSTLVNHLLENEIQKVRDVRINDSKGRHTTTHRQLFILPSGALMIDTPGMRELQIWNADAGVSEAFSDIEELAAHCRFGDCTHSGEPGCKVQEALADGSLDHARYENYQKMLREMSHLSRKQNVSADFEEKLKWKKIHMTKRKMDKK